MSIRHLATTRDAGDSQLLHTVVKRLAIQAVPRAPSQVARRTESKGKTDRGGEARTILVMQEFWQAALTVAGLGAVVAFVFWSLYRQWLKLPLFQKFTKKQQYNLFVLFLSFAFLFAFAGLVAWAYIEKDRQPAPAKPKSETPFVAYSHERRLDLTGWQLVPAERQAEKLSRALWTDRFKIRRLENTADSFCIRHATTGKPTPDFRSATHEVKATETTERPITGPQPQLRIFDVCLDVSAEPVDAWFDLQLEATYWNAFNKSDGAWAAIPVIHANELTVFEIVFPPTKPPVTWERREGPRDTKTSELVTDDAVVVTDGGTRLRWRIRTPRRNWVYKWEWKW